MKISIDVYIIYRYRCHFLIINQLAILISRTANISIPNHIKGFDVINILLGPNSTDPHNAKNHPNIIISIDMNTWKNRNVLEYCFWVGVWIVSQIAWVCISTLHHCSMNTLICFPYSSYVSSDIPVERLPMMYPYIVSSSWGWKYSFWSIVVIYLVSFLLLSVSSRNDSPLVGKNSTDSISDTSIFDSIFWISWDSADIQLKVRNYFSSPSITHTSPSELQSPDRSKVRATRCYRVVWSRPRIDRWNR